MKRVGVRAWIVGIALVAVGVTPSLGAIGASANYASQQSGSDYHYDLQLTNTGDTALRTFWFAWAPFGSFLPSVPGDAAAPAGWGAQVVEEDYGTSVLWNTTGAGLAPGSSLAGFEFTSADSPAALQGNDAYFGYYPVATSYVYATTVNANDPLPGQFGVFLAAPGPVPEPGCAAGVMAGVTSLAALRRRRG